MKADLETTKQKITAEEFLSWPEDGHQYELIEGEAYKTPSPIVIHQKIVGELHFILLEFLHKNRIAQVFVSPLDVKLAEDTVVQPNIFVILAKNYHKILSKNIEGAPDLCIEVLSPATSSRDRSAKFKVYADAGVPEVWYVDPSSQTVSVYELQPESQYVLRETLTPQGTLSTPLLPGLFIDLKRVC